MRIMFLIVFLFVTAGACSALGGDTSSLSDTQEVTMPVATPSSTTSTTTVVPTPTKRPAFFTEQFDSGYPVQHWQSFNLGPGETSDLIIQQEDDYLLFDLRAQDIYIYYMYTPYTYADVSLKLEAENRGRNNNNVSLVCRMNQAASTWYEYSLTSGGLWTLYAMDNSMYHTIASGGTNFLKQGQETNEYEMICQGDEITLLVNGKKVETIKESKYRFERGFVGFNISSIRDYSVLPITVAVNSFTINRP